MPDLVPLARIVGDRTSPALRIPVSGATITVSITQTEGGQIVIEADYSTDNGATWQNWSRLECNNVVSRLLLTPDRGQLWRLRKSGAPGRLSITANAGTLE